MRWASSEGGRPVTRQGERWLLEEFSRLDDHVALESIGCELSLVEVYDKVTLDE